MNQLPYRRPLGILLLAASALLTGCAQIKLGAPVATVENIQKAKAIGLQPVALGTFGVDKGRDAKLDSGISVRTNDVSSPVDGSFSKYLKESLSVELRAAGLLDPKAETTIEGHLTDNQLDAAIGQGKGSLGARFVVMRAGRALYDKEQRVSSTWESSFVGAIAIPAAVNEYTALYRKLVARLFDDPEFRSAVKP